MLRIPQQRVIVVLCSVVSSFAILGLSAKAQVPSDPNPSRNAKENKGLEFEVTTIKSVDPRASRIRTEADIDPNGTVRLYGMSLKDMISVAFDVRFWQIEGGEEWISKTLYNFVGKPPDTVRQTGLDTRHTLFGIEDPRLREMLQVELFRRFQLKLHHTSRTGKIYLLERTGNTSAVLPHKVLFDNSGSPPQSTVGSIGFAGRWVLYNTTMPELANFASSYVVHCTVVDHTGLVGGFDYESPREDPDETDIDQNTSFINLLKRLNLKLEPTKGQIQMLVIDRAAFPSPN